jgi:hypothetical protein
LTFGDERLSLGSGAAYSVKIFSKIFSDLVKFCFHGIGSMKGLATETVPRGHISQLEFPWDLY